MKYLILIMVLAVSSYAFQCTPSRSSTLPTGTPIQFIWENTIDQVPDTGKTVFNIGGICLPVAPLPISDTVPWRAGICTTYIQFPDSLAGCGSFTLRAGSLQVQVRMWTLVLGSSKLEVPVQGIARQATVRYYDIQGRRLSSPPRSGLYIQRIGHISKLHCIVR